MHTLYNLSSYNGKDVWDIFLNNEDALLVDFEIKKHNNYLIVKYNKSRLNYSNYMTLGLWRSVVLDTKNRRIVAFSPPKSLPWSDFAANNYLKDCQITEFQEGTMINLFFDKEANDWEISTKSGIGGKYKYFKETKKTFRYMFLEALNYCGLEFDMLNKSFCYSFVLQHPENRIVVVHKEIKLYLTNIYSFSYQENNMFVNEEPLNIKWDSGNMKQMELVGDMISPLRNIELNEKTKTWEDLFNEYQRMDIEYYNVGIQVYNKNNGMRTKLRNPSYEKIKYLKGNSPKLQYQYYNLRQAGKVSEFLKYYPEYKYELARFRSELHKWTKQLFVNYHDCYIKKNKQLKDYAHQFKPHMYNLHKLYLEELISVGNYVSMMVVVKYVNTLPPAKLMYAINYPYRKNTIDVISETFENDSAETVKC